MKKAIVCTTINPPTEALEKFRAMKDWSLIVVGDRKTPYGAYDGWDYLSPADQHSRFPVLSNLIGWDCIQRRNFGFIEAYRRGADIIATVDDDNIPFDNWGLNLIGIGRTGESREATMWETKQSVFDPLSVTNQSHLWHRGFPIPLLAERGAQRVAVGLITPDIQADLWNGAPDIDAIARVFYPDDVTFDTTEFFFSTTISPFNSQNTFVSRRVLPDYFMYPYIGRFDDIWASYHAQKRGARVVYGPPSVFQKRNPHDPIVDMKAEMFGYEHTMRFLDGGDVLPERSKAAFREYQRLMLE